MKKDSPEQIAQREQNRDRETQIVSDWMQKLAGQTELPRQLPTPGFLLFKARLIEKQSAAARVLRTIAGMQIVSVGVFALGIGWLLLKSQLPIGLLLKKTFLSLSSVAPLLICGIITAALICLAFAHFLSKTTEFKK